MSIRMIRTALILSLLLSFSLPALAGKIIHVPKDQPTIQAGIDAASNGDTVLVSPGKYYENINFSGKVLKVTSSGGPGVTIIDGNQAGAVVSFMNAGTGQATISGFTIQNGSFGGVSIFNSSPLVLGNVITGNCSDQGGVQVQEGAPIIKGNLINDNGLAQGCTNFAGVYVIYDSGTQVLGNVIVGNQGGGIYLLGGSSNDLIMQNTVTGNLGPGFTSVNTPSTLVQNLISQNHGAGITWFNPPITLINNTVANDSQSEVFATLMNSQVTMQNNLIVGTNGQSAVYCQGTDTPPSANSNDVLAENAPSYGGTCPDPTGTNGNISADPLFVDLLSANYHIQAGSPAIDAGDNAVVGLPKNDFDGDLRIANKIIDIGIDEYSRNTVLTLSSYALRYGGQVVGTRSASQFVTLTNHSKNPVGLNLIATGANFSQTNNCGASLAGSAHCQINVVFSPANSGLLNGEVGVFTSATGNLSPSTSMALGWRRKCNSMPFSRSLIK